jgi:hypothetical protein
VAAVHLVTGRRNDLDGVGSSHYSRRLDDPFMILRLDPELDLFRVMMSDRFVDDPVAQFVTFVAIEVTTDDRCPAEPIADLQPRTTGGDYTEVRTRQKLER